MRRIVGFVLLGLAGFLLTMAALLKWYAYPTLAVVPLDQDSVSVSVGENMTYFDKGTLSEQVDTLTSTLRVIGDVKAAETEGDNIAVWDKSTTTTRASDGVAISVGTIRAAFDRTTGAGVDCCGANIADEPVVFEGNIFKFPFNSPKSSVDWWDDDLRATVPFEYDGQETIQGLKCNRYVMTIEPTMTETLQVPSKVLGEPSGSMLPAENWYSVKRTYWVEPETGVIMDASEEVNTTLRYNGEDRVVATRGTTGYPDDQVKKNIDEYSSLGSQLHLVRVVLPLVGLIGGLLALLFGALFVLMARRGSSADSDEAARHSAAADDARSTSTT